MPEKGSPKAIDNEEQCFADLMTILEDKGYWKLIHTDHADMSCCQAILDACKKFNRETQKHDLQEALNTITSMPREEPRTSYLFSSVHKMNDSMIYLKIIVKNIFTLNSLDFNRLRTDYATKRRDHDMLKRAATSVPPRPFFLPPEKRLSSVQIQATTENVNNEKFISALYLYHKAGEEKQFNQLIDKIKLEYPSGKVDRYERHPALETLIQILKDKSYWQGKTSFGKVIEDYEYLFQESCNASRVDVTTLQALDMALFCNLKKLAPPYLASKAHDSPIQARATLLAAALHSSFDNFTEMSHSEGFKQLESNYHVAKSDLRSVFRPSGRSAA